jgi:predicted signal transduction protein with EAL and GGDEF domain
MGMKRSDNPHELASAIEDLEKRPQNRKIKRILAQLRRRFDKLVPEGLEPEAEQSEVQP